MRSIEFLNRTLLLTDYEAAKPLYAQLTADGHDPVKAAAMIYRHGYLDGKNRQKEVAAEVWRRRQENHKSRLAAEQSPPEATIEGSNNHE